MATKGYGPSNVALDRHGVTKHGDVYWNLPPAELYEHALRRGEGRLATNGAMVCTTGNHTGRTPSAKFTVEEPTTKDDICWGSVNQPLSVERFDALHRRIVEHYRDRDLFVRDMFAGADESTRLAIRVVTETAWHSLFACQLFIRPEIGSTRDHDPQFTILHAPSCKADNDPGGAAAGAFVVVNLAKRIVLIGGTAYAGEIKKSIFTIMNYLLPKSGVLSMHCSANVGSDNDVALFFGLSGTGKTTLSADPDRRLVGDDEHGWGESGVFNIEGGCYAKCIELSLDTEPQIFRAIRFGTVLENVVMDDATRSIDFDSDKITENTRAAYPLDYIENAVIPSIAGHPSNVVFLTCDAFGVLPPISKLTPELAMYHFLSGYTAKVAGTEAGVTEPKATFSACFGSPFLPLPPETYAKMLGQRLARHNTHCWLINTGWSGGPYGVGQRIKLRYTRRMVKAVLSGELDGIPFEKDSVFNVAVPRSCPDVPSELLTPRSTWREADAYEAKARELADRFNENFKSFENISAKVAAAAPEASRQ